MTRAHRVSVAMQPLAAGSIRHTFPTRTEKLLLNTGANQAAIAFQQWAGRRREEKVYSPGAANDRLRRHRLAERPGSVR